MCTGISIALSAAGTLMSAASAYQQSQAQKAQARYQAQVASNNAIIAQQNAASIKEKGVIAQQEHRRKVKAVKGLAKTQQAAKGFLVDDTADSSNQQAIQDIVELGKLDELRIKHNTDLEERRALIQGVNFQAQAGLYDLKASQQNPLLAGTSTLLAGASSTAKLGFDLGVFK
jgi:sRNA-binding protein